VNKYPGKCLHCEVHLPAGTGRLKQFYGESTRRLMCRDCEDRQAEIEYIGKTQSRAERKNQYSRSSMRLRRLFDVHHAMQGVNKGKTWGQHEKAPAPALAKTPEKKTTEQPKKGQLSLKLEGEVAEMKGDGLHKDLRQMMRRHDGWTAVKTHGGYVKLTHPQSDFVVIASSTPRDHRSIMNTETKMKRAFRRTADLRAQGQSYHQKRESLIDVVDAIVEGSIEIARTGES